MTALSAGEAPVGAPAPAPAPGTSRWRQLAPAGVVLAWIPLVLVADSVVGIGGQRLLGAVTWVLLLALLWRESPRTRGQVAVVVVFATGVEYCFAGWLGVYVYRLENVPLFVSPGHGLVYLAALCIGRAALTRSFRRPLITGTVIAGGAWALWGLTLSPRPDALGAFWYGCLLGFLVFGRRQRLVYVGAFLVVSLLEIIGTALGTWTWAEVDPILRWVSMGNPPSGAAGGYGWFDAAGIALAPSVVHMINRYGSRHAAIWRTRRREVSTR